MNYVGIDIGGTSVKIGVVDEKGNIIAKSSIPTMPTRNYEAIVKDIADEVNRVTSTISFEAIGIGCPGAVDSGAGVVAYANNLRWKDVPLADGLHKYIKKRIKVSNDANVAALGEARFGAGKDYSDSILVTLGTGVGGGIVVGRKLFEGYRSLGGEIGHMVIVKDGVPCTCGRRGCLEAYASATALIRQTIFEMNCDNLSSMWAFADNDLNKVDGRTAFECAKKGDKSAQKVVDFYLECLSDGITNLVNVFRSEAIIIGGGVSAQGNFLTEPLSKLVDKARYGGADSLPVKILTATLGNDAGIVGAAALVMND